jgi:hypothetical protein
MVLILVISGDISKITAKQKTARSGAVLSLFELPIRALLAHSE